MEIASRQQVVLLKWVHSTRPGTGVADSYVLVGVWVYAYMPESCLSYPHPLFTNQIKALPSIIAALRSSGDATTTDAYLQALQRGLRVSLAGDPFCLPTPCSLDVDLARGWLLVTPLPFPLKFAAYDE